MRIGIDARMWDEGGVGRYIRNLVGQLHALDRSNKYTLFVRNRDVQNLKSQISNLKWKIVRTDIQWHSVQEQLTLPSILNREKLDLVHFPYPSVPILYNRPFVVTIHDLIPYHFPTGHASTLPFPLYWIKQLGYRLVLSQSVKRAKMVIAVSNATKEDVVRNLKVRFDDVVVTYEGVDGALSAERKVQSAKLQLKAKSYFLYVGNAYPHKNLDRLLQVLKILVSQYPDISIILVVKDDYFSKRLQEKVKSLKADEKVRFFYNVSDSELSSLYRGAKALIAPSLMEGFDLPVVEAMANKCLVIVSEIPVHREIAGDVALYFNPDNTQDIAEKLKAVYSNDTYHYSNRVQKGFERAKTFSWKNMAIKTLRAYESCSSASSE